MIAVSSDHDGVVLMCGILSGKECDDVLKRAVLLRTPPPHSNRDVGGRGLRGHGVVELLLKAPQPVVLAGLVCVEDS